jgi:hypothetical protein
VMTCRGPRPRPVRLSLVRHYRLRRRGLPRSTNASAPVTSSFSGLSPGPPSRSPTLRRVSRPTLRKK